ncbi:MAG: RNA-binding domain-containing protein [Candidatus Njordarchaeales archaeon]
MGPNKLRPVSVKIAAHVHATEDENKVIKAIRNILPPDVKLEISREVISGHYGNRIIRLEIKISNKKDVERIFEWILSRISGFLYPNWIAERFDTSNKSLYLRLDKQAAYMGEIKLGWGDDIVHLVFKFPGYLHFSPEDLEQEVKSFREKSD